MKRSDDPSKTTSCIGKPALNWLAQNFSEFFSSKIQSQCIYRGWFSFQDLKVRNGRRKDIDPD